MRQVDNEYMLAVPQPAPPMSSSPWWLCGIPSELPSNVQSVRLEPLRLQPDASPHYGPRAQGTGYMPDASPHYGSPHFPRAAAAAAAAPKGGSLLSPAVEFDRPPAVMGAEAEAAAEVSLYPVPCTLYPQRRRRPLR